MPQKCFDPAEGAQAAGIRLLDGQHNITPPARIEALAWPVRLLASRHSLTAHLPSSDTLLAYLGAAMKRWGGDSEGGAA